MKANELKTKSKSELHQEVDALLREQFNLRMQKGSGQTTKTHRFKEIRRMIARIKTILHQVEQTNN